MPGGITLSIHSWVIRMSNRLIVIDTGIGNDRDRDGNPLFDHLHTDFDKRLAAVGVDRKDVDTVLMTHLHIDHVGWNTYHDGDSWRPMFPNARYIFSEFELRQWQQQPKRQKIYEDSIKPVLDAGLAHTLGASESVELGEGLLYMPTPGHSPGHASIILESNDEYAMFGGDLMHHPRQVSFPHWNSSFCEDKASAEVSRRHGLKWCVEHDALYFSTHFADSSVGRIELASDSNRYEWRFV
ncbi:MBL fold metallo-hydrolase [Alcaligenaceae bacterium]|nr:MBL fold metallo-hydrolase [Alcaligenaceae bacterium]